MNDTGRQAFRNSTVFDQVHGDDRAGDHVSEPHANYGMLDNYVAEGAPFIWHIDYTQSVIEGTRDFPQVPPM
jgi:hypothetical protein